MRHYSSLVLLVSVAIVAILSLSSLYAQEQNSISEGGFRTKVARADGRRLANSLAQIRIVRRSVSIKARELS